MCSVTLNTDWINPFGLQVPGVKCWTMLLAWHACMQTSRLAHCCWHASACAVFIVRLDVVPVDQPLSYAFGLLIINASALCCAPVRHAMPPLLLFCPDDSKTLSLAPYAPTLMPITVHAGRTCRRPHRLLQPRVCPHRHSRRLHRQLQQQQSKHWQTAGKRLLKLQQHVRECACAQVVFGCS